MKRSRFVLQRPSLVLVLFSVGNDIMTLCWAKKKWGLSPHHYRSGLVIGRPFLLHRVIVTAQSTIGLSRDEPDCLVLFAEYKLEPIIAVQRAVLNVGQRFLNIFPIGLFSTTLAQRWRNTDLISDIIIWQYLIEALKSQGQN